MCHHLPYFYSPLQFASFVASFKHSTSSFSNSCNACDRKFPTGRKLRKHERDSHQAKVTTYDCPICCKQLASRKGLEAHLEVHPTADETGWHPCPYCEKKYQRAMTVIAHIKSKHIGARPFVCEECGKTFNTKGLVHINGLGQSQYTALILSRQRSISQSNCSTSQ